MCTVTTTDIRRLRTAGIATIGEKTGVNIGGMNAKNVANANGAGMNGETMSAGNEAGGVTGMTGATKRS